MFFTTGCEAFFLDALLDILKCVRDWGVRFAALIGMSVYYLCPASTTCNLRLYYLCPASTIKTCALRIVSLRACEICASVDHYLACAVCVAFSGHRVKPTTEGLDTNERGSAFQQANRQYENPPGPPLSDYEPLAVGVFVGSSLLEDDTSVMPCWSVPSPGGNEALDIGTSPMPLMAWRPQRRALTPL